MRPQSQKGVVAHRGELTIRIERAVKSSIISHPCEDAA